MTDIFIIDTETTGLKGANSGDNVVEIGIARWNSVTDKVYPVYDAIIGYDVDSWSDEKKHSWVFENTDLTLDDVKNGTEISQVIGILSGKNTDLNSGILKFEWITSYNEEFDFDRFLFREPFDLLHTANVCRAPCLMIAASKLPDIKLSHAGQSRYPKLQTAYEYLYPDSDPAGINGKQDHRALSDAIVAAYVLKGLHSRGLYQWEESDDS